MNSSLEEELQLRLNRRGPGWTVSSKWKPLWDATKAQPRDVPAPVYQWIPLTGDDANTDRLERELPPCPACGSVWVEVTALGFRLPDLEERTFGIYIPELGVARVCLVEPVLAPVSKVQVLCAEGHTFRTDSKESQAVSEWPFSFTMDILPEVAVSAMYMGKMARKLGLK